MNTKSTVFLFLIILCTSLNGQIVSTLVPGPSTFNDGLAIDKSGNLYAALYLGSTVTKITPSGQTSIFASGMKSPNGLAFAPDGNLYVPNALGAKITKITPSGDTSTFISIPDPGAILINDDGSMLVAQYNLNKVSLIDTNKNISVFLNDDIKLNGPIGLVRDKNGVLYVGNFNNGRIYRCTAEKELISIGQVPGGLGFMTIVNNTIFATAFALHKIYKIPTGGGGATVLIGTGTPGKEDGTTKASFHNPNGIVASLTGDTLFVSDYASQSLRIISGVLKFTTSVKNETSILNEFHLEQNYPNPFNPATTISFSVPKQSNVGIKVYSMIGHELATLLSGTIAAGTHSVLFDGARLASGTYLIRMNYGSTFRTIKATLLK